MSIYQQLRSVVLVCYSASVLWVTFMKWRARWQGGVPVIRTGARHRQQWCPLSCGAAHCHAVKVKEKGQKSTMDDRQGGRLMLYDSKNTCYSLYNGYGLHWGEIGPFFFFEDVCSENKSKAEISQANVRLTSNPFAVFPPPNSNLRRISTPTVRSGATASEP